MFYLRRVNYLKVNNQILTFISSIRNLEIGLLKIRKNSKSSYFNQYVSLNRRNVLGLWSGSKSILNVGKCKNSYITFILNKNKYVGSPKYIANIFNDFFAMANVGKTTEQGIPGKVIALLSIFGVTTQDQFLISCHFA